ncbi:uncharacterized protein LOC128163207 [Crassostrea angulata]|uniref:uncharacterized protein LOC128163207 n=1 Tax=Magallana angulata TaxID=2784310 RepID=UPI0022B1CB70|nr:uncharacterized protein LOC128163207 [Crassostrea angulata]
MDPMEPHFYKDHHVTYESFFTSPALVYDLLDKRSHSTGTVINTRKGMPSSFKTTPIQKGEIRVKTRGGVMAILWADKRVVSLVTTTGSPRTLARLIERHFPSVIPEGKRKKCVVCAGNDRFRKTRIQWWCQDCEVVDLLTKVYEQFSIESQEGRVKYLQNPLKRLSVATGISEKTLKGKVDPDPVEMVVEDMQVLAPKKKRGPSRKLDDFDEDYVKRTIHDMQLKGQYVSLRRLSDVLVERGVRITKTPLGRLVKDLGFKFYKAGSNRRYIGERNDIVSMRHTYLRSIRKFREEGRPIVYLDETWLNTNHVARGDWVDCPRTSTSAFEAHRGGHGRFVPSGKGSRLIIVDAGSSAVGMIPGSALIFESKTGNQDYHDEMNSENFTKWFTEQLLPNLPANSVIVMDNASYHSHLDPESRCPTSSAPKAEIQSWLDSKGIHYNPRMIKAELVTLVKQHKPRPKYVIDDLASQSGHTVLHLPPYHCELNPIELVWAELKSFVARSNATFKKEKVKELFIQARSTYGVEKRRKVESHVIREVEEKLWKLD